MLARIRSHRPSPSMVVALLALFVALGGSSYAAIALKNNSVRSNHIKNGQVKRADLGAGAVDASKVQNGGLLAEDFAAGQLPAGAQGPKGDPGANGQNGANGADGQDGADGADGQDGADGLDGVALVTQARCGNCPRQSVQANAGQPTTMSDGAWTQEPGEGNLLFFEVHWTPPADTCTGAFGATPGAVVQVKLDGIVVAEWRRPTGSGFGVVTDQATPKYVFASATATPHALTFEVRDNCTGSENATVHQLRVDVASAPG